MNLPLPSEFGVVLHLLLSVNSEPQYPELACDLKLVFDTELLSLLQLHIPIESLRFSSLCLSFPHPLCCFFCPSSGEKEMHCMASRQILSTAFNVYRSMLSAELSELTSSSSLEVYKSVSPPPKPTGIILKSLVGTEKSRTLTISSMVEFASLCMCGSITGAIEPLPYVFFMRDLWGILKESLVDRFICLLFFELLHKRASAVDAAVTRVIKISMLAANPIDVALSQFLMHLSGIS